MPETDAKRATDSRTEQIQIVMPGDANGYGRLFGGRLLEWIDIVAAVVARRHAGREVTTASIHNLDFTAPAYVNETVVLVGCVTWAGRTSMEIRVDAYAENLKGGRNLINQAHVVMVALDENEKPAPVPPLLIENDQQRAEWNEGQNRRGTNKTRPF